jgi:hypothetical protein
MDGIVSHATCKRPPIRIDGRVAYVPLTKGYEARIDVADIPLVEGRSWCALEARRKDGSVSHVYAGNWSKGRKFLMHRVIAKTPDGMVTDHIDGDGLNNLRSNLRPATKAENSFNAKLSSANTSGYKGVSWYKAGRKWRAIINVRGRVVLLGAFHSAEAAAEAYARASAELHGEFGRTA